MAKGAARLRARGGVRTRGNYWRASSVTFDREKERNAVLPHLPPARSRPAAHPRPPVSLHGHQPSVHTLARSPRPTASPLSKPTPSTARDSAHTQARPFFPPRMYRNTYQAGFLSILYSIGSKPLQIWDKKGECPSEPRMSRCRPATFARAKAQRTAPRDPPFCAHRPPRPCPRPPRARAVKNGHIKRITDPDIQSSVLEVCGSNVSTTYITCPADPKKTLGIKLPFLVMILKNLKKYFTFEVTVLDDKNVHRRFRASNYQVSARAGGRRKKGGKDDGVLAPPPGGGGGGGGLIGTV
jgi:hypothetical protein